MIIILFPFTAEISFAGIYNICLVFLLGVRFKGDPKCTLSISVLKGCLVVRGKIIIEDFDNLGWDNLGWDSL